MSTWSDAGSPRLFLRQHLVEGDLPLPQADADEDQVLAQIDASDFAYFSESLNIDGVIRLQSGAPFAKLRGRGLFAFDASQLVGILLTLPVGLVPGGQCLRARLLRIFAKLLETAQFRRPSTTAAQVAAGSLEQFTRQLEPARDLQGIAHTELANVQPVRGEQRF